MKFSLYSKKNRLDEMQEQTMRKIESHGFWLLWGSLLAAWIVQTVFFLLVFFAAITSSISLMETVVSMVRDKFHWNRVVTTVVVTLCTVAIGSLSVLGYGPLANFKIFGMQMLDFFDFISNSVLMPIVAFLTCILIGHVVGTKVIADEVGLSAKFTGEKLHRVMIKWVAPILLVVILVAQVLSAFGIITI